MLNEYNQKRNFTRTSEPPPQSKTGEGDLVFVVQKHAARRLHYDFRLELDGVLKSWAIPNGPSLDPKVKRLAVMVEDHPIDYRSFEGIIPKGEYGAGQVIIWDEGTYSPDEEGKLISEDRNQAQERIRQGLEKGKISLYLRGSKLQGSWALVKMQHTQKDWLLIKHQDDFAKPGVDIQQEDSSIFSGLTIEDLREKRSEPQPGSLPELDKIPGAHLSQFPSTMRPMLAATIKKPFSDPRWLFEPKLDGYRIIAMVRNGTAKLISRNGIEVNHKYPALVGSLSRQTVKEIVIDGEVVALDEAGRPCFQCLQNHLNFRAGKETSSTPKNFTIIYYVFDILYLNGYDLSPVPLYQRKKLLSQVLHPLDNLRLVDYFETDGETLYESSVNYGLEGVMAKLKDSVYVAGRRSQNWLKIKAIQSGEFVIGGYTKGTGNRASTFGALLLGSFNDQGQLVFVGHVGSGFDDKNLSQLRQQLDTLKSDKMPFVEKPPLNGSPTWLRPELVAEVKFSEKTQEGFLRIPIFKRLREDKSPSEVQLVEITESSEAEISNTKSTNSSENSGLKSILDQLENPSQNFNLELEGYKIPLSNLDKAIWPAVASRQAVSKRDLLIYLTKVSPYILPHLLDRPITLTRYPNGINSEHFFQKHWESPVPGYVKTVSLSEHDSDNQDYFMCNNFATLVWLGQMANIDLHAWFSRVTPEPLLMSLKDPAEKTPDFFSGYPDFIIFDIDPYIYSGKESKGAEPELNRHAFEQTGQVAIWLKEVLDSLSLNSYLKTSGQTGLHIYVPILRQFDFHETHSAAKTIAVFLLQKHPQEVTMDWSVAKRSGKIFLDYNQNVRGKTLACAYSPRASPLATVSTPLNWGEIGNIYPTDFTILNMPDRLARIGDIWSTILDKKSDLGKILNLKE